jgi:hypothetical protein
MQIWFIVFCRIIIISNSHFGGEDLIPDKPAVGDEAGNIQIYSSLIYKVLAVQSHQCWNASIRLRHPDIKNVKILF